MLVRPGCSQNSHSPHTAGAGSPTLREATFYTTQASLTEHTLAHLKSTTLHLHSVMSVTPHTRREVHFSVAAAEVHTLFHW